MQLQSDITCLHHVLLYDYILLPSVDSCGLTCTTRDIVVYIYIYMYERSWEGFTTTWSGM